MPELIHEHNGPLAAVPPLRSHSVTEKQFAAVVEASPLHAATKTKAQTDYLAARAAHRNAGEQYGLQSAEAYPAQRKLQLAESALLADTATRLAASPRLAERYPGLAARAERPTYRPLERSQLVNDALAADFSFTASVRPSKVAEPVKVDHSPVREMTQREIVDEVKTLHGEFQRLTEAYESTPRGARGPVLAQMREVVNREGALREGYMNRAREEARIESAQTERRVGEERRVMRAFALGMSVSQ